MATEKEVQESELEGSTILKDLRTAADILGGELAIKYDDNDMSYRVCFTRNGHMFNISLEALEAVYSITKSGQSELIDVLRAGTSE